MTIRMSACISIPRHGLTCSGHLSPISLNRITRTSRVMTSGCAFAAFPGHIGYISRLSSIACWLVRCLLIAVIISLTGMGRPAIARPLVAEISSHHITIHSAFEGTELLLYGVRNAPGDMVVVVRGPSRDAIVRRKRRVFGVWVNRESETFPQLPSFYAVASSRRFEEIERSVYFNALGIGYREAITTFHPPAKPGRAPDSEQRTSFATALLADLRRRQLYHDEVTDITFLGEGLFSTRISFPDNTPTGAYTAEVYLFDDGALQGVHTTPIYVYKSGLDSFIFQLANNHPLLYGAMAIILALLGGMVAVRLFKRV